MGTLPKFPWLLRVLGRLPWLGLCRGLGRQASEKPSHKQTFVDTLDAPNRAIGWLQRRCRSLGGGPVFERPDR